MLDTNHILLWYKNHSIVQIFSLEIMCVVQNIFLPKNEGWVQIMKVGTNPDKSYEICIRNFKKLNFYKLDLNQTPPMKLDKTINIQKDGVMILNCFINKSYICNYKVSLADVDKINVEFNSRATNDLTTLVADRNDQLVHLNQEYQSSAKPLLIRFSQNRLSLLVDLENLIFDFDVFKRFNFIN